MCEFCVKHGEGKKWYLQAKNYAEDLWSDLRRRRMTADFFNNFNVTMSRNLANLDRLARAPRFVQAIVRGVVTRQQKKTHFGQVVPIEDVERIFEFTDSVTRTPCVCRRVTRGREDRYCFGVTMGPTGGLIGQVVDPSYWQGPDGVGAERLDKPTALQMMKDFESEGLVHSVWTFVTPFIGGICNCDRTDCIAMRTTVGAGVPVMFKGEYVASVDWDKCTGCRSCMRVCQFGAIGYSAGPRKASIDALHCYGCGVCRSVCKQEAIALRDRASVPLVAGNW
jgi:Pyruvate/2-oxoacid:ferredoxin oxidoreductase delta subunit